MPALQDLRPATQEQQRDPLQQWQQDLLIKVSGCQGYIDRRYWWTPWLSIGDARRCWTLPIEYRRFSAFVLASVMLCWHPHDLNDIKVQPISHVQPDYLSCPEIVLWTVQFARSGGYKLSIQQHSKDKSITCMDKVPPDPVPVVGISIILILTLSKTGDATTHYYINLSDFVPSYKALSTFEIKTLDLQTQ